MATVSDVRLLPPEEFADESKFPDEWITASLNRAALFMNSEHWGDRYEEGHKLLAAHLLADMKSGSTGGTRGRVISERLGPASRTYASPSAGGQEGEVDHLNLLGTPYGRQYRALRESLLPVGPMALFDGVTGNPDA